MRKTERAMAFYSSSHVFDMEMVVITRTAISMIKTTICKQDVGFFQQYNIEKPAMNKPLGRPSPSGDMFSARKAVERVKLGDQG